jgi:hypothetical protein
MAHVRSFASALCGGLLLASASAAIAATKVDEGFASQHERYGHFSRPMNRIEQGTMGHDAYYWIQWRDHPVGRHTFRCKVTYQGRAAAIVDEEITYEDSVSDGYSLCGFSPRKGRDPEGLYTFTQHLNGAKVGEAVLRIEITFLEGLRLFPWKIALIIFAVVVFALGWLARKKDGPRSLPA